ncbi:MAG: hypothetical protein ACLRFL_02015 [Clostridia bacterium]
MYYNRYDDNCDDKKYPSREKEKCCIRVTEYCCYPSYYTEEKEDDKCEEKHSCPHKKDCTCNKNTDRQEDRKETTRNRCCCPLFRHWCW